MKQYCTIKLLYDYEDTTVNAFFNDLVSEDDMLEHMKTWDYGEQSVIEDRMLDELPIQEFDSNIHTDGDHILMWKDQYKCVILIRKLRDVA